MTTHRPLVVLFAAAHPDDDVVGASGFIALHADDPDLRFVLVHATDGEQGEIAAGSGATRETLGAVRREEDVRSWEVVGRPPDRHEWLGFPDGGLADLPDGVLQSEMERIIGEERPDLVLTFGPDGVTGHPDHIAIGAATDAAFHALRATPGPGFQRLLHGAYPQSALDRENARRVERGIAPWDPAKVYEPRGTPDDQIAVSIDQTAVVDVILRAFREHRTQWAPPWTEHDERGWQSAVGMSHMAQAWPPRPAGAPVLADPLVGLTR